MVTELRVHGVSGTPAQDMLDRPLLSRVAGDGDAGFFRPHPAYGGATGPGGANLEAYRWGNLTAGAAARALWLLLLPFMLANVALWMRPATGKRAKTAIRALCRVFALSVTATFVLSFVEVSVDLVGWQCGGTPDCLRDRPYLAPLATGFFATPSRRIALLAVVPILVVAFLWFLGRRTWSRYEAYPVDPRGDGDGLAHPCFWNGKPLVGRLRAIHIAFSYATIDAVLIGVLAPHDRRPMGYWLAGATALVLLLCLVVVCLRGMVDRDSPARWAHPFARGLATTALLLTVLIFGYAMSPRSEWRATGALPWLGTSITLLFAAQTGLLLVLGLVILATSPRGTYLNGLAAPIVASIGLGISVAFAAGAAYRVADFLDRTAQPSPGDYAGAPPLQPPSSFEWAGLGFVLLLALLALVALTARFALLRRLLRYARVVTDADFRGGRQRDRARAKQIDTAIADALITDHAGRLLAWVYTPAALAAVAFTVLAILGRRPVRLAPTGSATADLLSFTVNLGTYLIGLAVLALIVIGILAYRRPRLRRVVGVLWDLGTFWPRSAHPLAPPCYAERVVPELVKRTTWLATEQGGVVLSGHSQGSMLAAATVLQLPREARSATGLLTYGSPLRRLYARYFPAYVDDAVLARVGANLTEPGQRAPRWVNLWRDTDPIGGVVDLPARDVRWVDPSSFDIPPDDSVHPRVDGHSNYQLAPAFGDAVTAVARDLRPRRAALPQPPAQPILVAVPVLPEPPPPALPPPWPPVQTQPEGHPQPAPAGARSSHPPALPAAEAQPAQPAQPGQPETSAQPQSPAPA